MSKTKSVKDTAQLDEVLTSTKPTTTEEQEILHVVLRGGHRVSDREYTSANEQAALNERDFWQRIINRHPDGTKVEIVEFNKKLHRVW